MKKLSIILAILIGVIVVTGATAFTINHFYNSSFKAEIINDNEIIYPKYSWYIKFNKKLNQITVNEKTLYIENENKEKVEVEISINEENNIVKIEPVDYYEGWMKYNLVITKKIKSNVGESIKETLKKDFNMQDSNFNVSVKDELAEVKKDIENEEDLFITIVDALIKKSESKEINLKKPDENYNIENIKNYIKLYMPFLYMNVKDIKNEDSKILITYNIKKKELGNKSKDLLKKSKTIADDLKYVDNDIDKESMIYKEILKDIPKKKDLRKEGKNDELYNENVKDLFKELDKYDDSTIMTYLTMNYCDIPCLVVTGLSGEKEHMWNLAKINDNFVHIDMPWNLLISSRVNKGSSYRFFNLNDENIDYTHSWPTDLYPECKSFSNFEKICEDNLYEVKDSDKLSEFLEKSIKNDVEIVTLKIEDKEFEKYNIKDILNEILSTKESY
ncbi:MAG: hypothetical protein ABF289_10755, partial [Clostridiales bacterium]